MKKDSEFHRIVKRYYVLICLIVFLFLWQFPDWLVALFRQL